MTACAALQTGCTNVLAFNYDPAAELDDGSCEAIVIGCDEISSSNYNPLANVNQGGECIAFSEVPSSLVDVQLRPTDRSPTMMFYYATRRCAEVPYWLTVITTSVNTPVRLSLLMGRSPTIGAAGLTRILDASPLKEGGLLRLNVYSLDDFAPGATPNGPSPVGAFVNLAHEAAANEADVQWNARNCSGLSEERRKTDCAGLTKKDDWKVMCTPSDATPQTQARGGACGGNEDLTTVLSAGVEYAVVVIPSNVSFFQFRKANEVGQARSLWRAVASLGPESGEIDRFWAAERTEIPDRVDAWDPTASRLDGESVPPLPAGFPAGLGLFSLQIYAEPGSIETGALVASAPDSLRVPSVCGNGIVEGFEQCDSRGPVPALDRSIFDFIGSEIEGTGDSSWTASLTDTDSSTSDSPYFKTALDADWCSRPKLRKASRSRASTQNTYYDMLVGPTDLYVEDPGHDDNGLYGGGCSGLLASFSFEVQTYQTEEGKTLDIKVIRELPPHWLPHYEMAPQGIGVLVSTRDGSGSFAAQELPDPGSNMNIGDYGAIKGEKLVFKAGDLEQTLQVIINSDGVDEYQTEHFELYLSLVPGPVCQNAEERDCVYISKLGHPHVVTVQIIGADDWFTTPVQILVIGCTVLLMFFTGAMAVWSRGARRDSIIKYQSTVHPDAVDINMINMMRDGGRGGAPRGGSRATENRPNMRSPSMSAGSPSFGRAGNGSPSFGQGSPQARGATTRRKAVLAVEDLAEMEAPTASADDDKQSANHRSEGSFASASGKKGGQKKSKSKKDGGGGGTPSGLDDGALAALASTSVSARRGARKGSVSQGPGDPRLSERMRGGGAEADENIKSRSGRHRRGSVKEVQADTGSVGGGVGGGGSTGRHRRGSVKEVSTKAAVAAVVAAGSSGRHRRGSVKEITSAANGGPATGRHRRGSVKEVAPAAAANSEQASNAGMLQALMSASMANSRRHRRASAAAMADFSTPAAAAPESAPSNKKGRRKRRTSVADASDLQPGTTAVAAAATTVRRHRRLSASAVPESAPATEVAKKKSTGRHRRGSVKEVSASEQTSNESPASGSAVVESMDFGSISMSRRHQKPAIGAGSAERSPSFKSPTTLKSPTEAKASPIASSSFKKSRPGTEPAHMDPIKPSNTKTFAPKRRGGGYQNAALFTATQAALAHSQQVLDEHKGLIGKCRILAPILYGVLLGGGVGLAYLELSKTELSLCEGGTECKAYQVGDGKCDWVCNTADCSHDGGDCEFYTESCASAFELTHLPESQPAVYGHIYKTVAGTTSGCFHFDDVTGGPAAHPLNDTVCDLRCNHSACGYDGGDCLPAALGKSPQCSEGCFMHMLGDGTCQPECETTGCLFDMRDCQGGSKRTQWVDNLANRAQSPVPKVKLKDDEPTAMESLREATVCQNTNAPWLRASSPLPKLQLYPPEIETSGTQAALQEYDGACGYNHNITALKWLLDYTVEEALDDDASLPSGTYDESLTADVKDGHLQEIKRHKDSMKIHEDTVVSYLRDHEMPISDDEDRLTEIGVTILRGFRQLLAAGAFSTLHSCLPCCLHRLSSEVAIHSSREAFSPLMLSVLPSARVE